MNLYLRLLMTYLKARRGRRLGVWDVARTAFRVLPNDLDQIGHMNNARYLAIMDLGRMDLMLRSGFWSKTTRRGWYPVVAGQSISYRRSLKPGQRYEVHSEILGMDDNWFFLEQTFVVGEDVYAHAIVRARFLRKSGGSVSHDELLELAGPMPEGRGVLPEWITEWSDGSKPPKKVSELHD